MWDVQAEGVPWHLARPPISPVRYSLGMPWCPTRPPRVRVLVGVFGSCFCANWCATSLVQGSVRVAMAVCCAAQHATLHSTAQHPCALQHNATQEQYIPSVLLTAVGGQLCRDNFGVNLEQQFRLNKFRCVI